LTRHAGIVTRFSALVAAIALGACGGSSTPAAVAPATAPARGGELVTALRTDPRSFNRLKAQDSTTDLLTILTQAKLVRINNTTQEVEPWLAESWTTSDDRRRVTLKLREHVAFSDGEPFTADDVLFTFEAVYDKRADTVLADSMQTAAGQRLTVTAPDAHTVEIAFATPFAPGVRLLDNLPILPRHKLGAALKDGSFARAWSVSTPPSDVVGLGPFVLTQYVPGQRLVFARNPHYWRKAADGTPLPYLDKLTVEIIPDQNAELLRLQAGQLDATVRPLGPEAYATLRRAGDTSRVKLLDLGLGLEADAFWINLKPGAFAGDPRAAWLQRDELRRAISMAVDRKAFADTVFLGAAEPVYGPFTPSNRKWYWEGTPKVPYDPAGAKAILATIGLVDRKGRGVLEDAKGTPVRFTLLTQKGRAPLERGATVIRDDLKKIGITVDLAMLDGNTVISTVMGSQKYDAVYFNPLWSDTDPALTQDVWLSAGTSHFWNLEQKTPATPWERQIDELMAKQVASPDEAERKRLFDEVQRVFAEHVPIVYFAVPHVYAAISARVANATPALGLYPILWAPDTLAVVH